MKSYQYFIQALMWKQCCNESNIKQMIAKCLKADPSESERMSESQVNHEMVTEFISECNRILRPYNMQISRGPNESDGTVFYALINKTDDEITRLSTQWKNEEILFFRKLISAIIESENSFISSTKALNIGREDKISMTLVERLIDKLSEQKWIEEIADGNIAIGVRTLLELSVYIRDRFEVQDCFRCQMLCIRGANCLNCDIKMHFHCADSRFIQNNKCPNCSKEWARSEVFATNSSSNSNGVVESYNGSNSIAGDNEDEEQDNQPIRAQRVKRTRRSR